MQTLGQETVRTYRYVRVSIVAAIALLATGLLLQIVEDDWQIAHSISAYYYSPVQPMLVGVLVASAFLLVAVRGRPGWEEVLLNIAAMLLPIVAFVPTPITGGCIDGSRCVPAEVLPAVELSVSTLLIVGVPGLVGALAVWLGRVSVDRSARLSITIAVLVWVVVSCWYGWSETWIGRESFFAYAHYVAAVLVFCFMVAVAFINARRSKRSVSIAGSRVPYRLLYTAIALAMALVIVGALGYGVANDWPTDTTLIFWVEAALLALFALFWVVQTAEFWNLGLPEQACEAPGTA
ncbi:MAG: hypothetical protein WCA29_10180 [Jiangellales bacterium]